MGEGWEWVGSKSGGVDGVSTQLVKMVDLRSVRHGREVRITVKEPNRGFNTEGVMDFIEGLIKETEIIVGAKFRREGHLLERFYMG